MGVFVNRGAAHILASALLAASIAPAQAEDRALWRCDTPNGHYDQRFFPIPGTAATISGKLIVNKAYIGLTWDSIAKITVAQGGSGDCHCSGVSLVASDKPKVVNYYATANGADTEMAQSGYRTPTPFRISFSPENMMTIQIGNEKPQIKAVRLLHPEHDFLVMSCSGAGVSFLDVQIQYDFRGKTVTHVFEEQDRFSG